MALSAFADKTKPPKTAEVIKVLGRAGTHWEKLIAHLAAEYEPLEEAWGFAGAAWGWSLRLKQKKRTILYMTPCKGFFFAGFALGENAVKAAHESALPETILAEIDGAKKYAEGRGVRLEIKNKKDVEAVKKLAAIKMAN